MCSLPSTRNGLQVLAQVSPRRRGQAPERRQKSGKTAVSYSLGESKELGLSLAGWGWQRCSDAERPREGAQALSFGR